MAEAAVEDPVINKFFCHKCSVEIPRVLEDYTCPTCLGGFIEELNAPSTSSEETSLEHSEDDMDDLPQLDLINETLGQELGDLLFGLGPFGAAGRGGQERDRERRVTRSRSSNTERTGNEDETAAPRSGGRYRPATFRNRGFRPSVIALIISLLSTDRDQLNRRVRRFNQFYPAIVDRFLSLPGMDPIRERGPRGRDILPIEHMIQDFIVNLTGVGWGPVGPGGRGNGPVLFLGNPGDYAWGREGLDAIVTQLLNQMDVTGPPPLDKEKIKEIPTTVITQEQVDTNLQCSVCWEDFKVDEDVRKLQCEHVYHEPCIIPWLQLHGTCPICRKTLFTDSDENNQGNMDNNMGNMSGLAAIFRAAQNNSSRTSSTSSSTSTSSNTTTGSSQTNNPPPSSDFHMDLEFD